MSEFMNEQTARIWFLERIRQRLVQSRAAGKGCLELRRKDFEAFSEDMEGWTPSEVSALYKRLVQENFIRRIQKDMGERFLELRGVMQYAWIEDLTDRGYLTIGVLQDPHEQLVRSLDALVEAVEMLSERAAPEEKERVQQAAEELRTFGRGLAPGAALLMVKTVAASMGVHIP